MNKLLNHTTAAVALLALTLTGCHDRLRGLGAEPDQGAERTSLTVTLRTEVGAFGATRADVITDAQDTEVPGATDTGEDLVKHLTLAMQPGLFLSSDDPKAVAGTTNEYTVLFKDIHYPGERELKYSVYLGQRLPGLSLADFDADKEVTYDQLKTLTSDTGGFVMTSEAGTKKITLKPGITDPSKANGNYLSCDVERVVSKAQVTSLTRKSIDFSQFNEKYFSKGDVEGAAELSFFAGWCIAGSAKSAYLFRNHAGRRTLGATGDADAGFYTGLPTVSAKGKEAGRYDLTKLSEVTSRETTLEGLLSHLLPIGYEGKTPTLRPGYNGPGEKDNQGSSEKPLSENDLFPELRSVASPYFLEHALSETNADRTPYPAKVTFADITYAKIFMYLIGVDGYLKGYYLTSGGGTRESNPNYREEYNRVYTSKYNNDNENDFEGLKNIPDSYGEPMETPKASWLAVSKPTPLTEEANLRLERRYLVPVSDEWRTAHLDSKYMKSADEYISHEMLIPSDETYRFKQITFSDGPRWFFEMRDLPCSYYIGKQDGKLYNTLLAARAAGNSQSYKYSVLSCYLVPLNAQKGANDLVYNCDTRRNNIYDLWITGVSDMGYNYDPVDPYDPLLPKPEDNPDEPETVVPSVNTYPQAIRVKARILKWNYIHYTADLKAMTGDTK